MTVRDVTERMDGWTNVQVRKYVDIAPYGRYEPLYDSTNEGWINVPEDLEDLEVTTIRIENNTIVLETEEN